MDCGVVMDVWSGVGCEERLWICNVVVDVRSCDGCEER